MRNLKNNRRVFPVSMALPMLLSTSALLTYSYAQTGESKNGTIVLPASLNSSNAKGAALSEVQLNAFWQKVEQNKVARISSTWRFERQSNALPTFDVDKEMAKVDAANGRVKGVSKEAQEKILADNRKFAQDTKDGSTSGSQMHFVRVGPIVKVEIIDDATYVSSGKIRIYDFYDAQKQLAVNLDSPVDLNSKIDKNGFATNARFSGTITRNDRSEILPRSSPNEAAVILAAANVADYFPRKETIVSTEGNLIYLDKSVKEPQTGTDMTVRLVLDKESLQPMRLLTSWLSKNRAGWMGVYEVVATKSVNAIAIPSKVALYNAESAKPGGGVETYVLESVKINDAVDPQEIKLPPSAKITDYRFGKTQQDAIPYKLTEGVPLTDEQVKKLLGERPEVPVNEVKQTTANATPLLMVVGLCLFCVGGVLWKKGS